MYVIEFDSSLDTNDTGIGGAQALAEALKYNTTLTELM